MLKYSLILMAMLLFVSCSPIENVNENFEIQNSSDELISTDNNQNTGDELISTDNNQNTNDELVVIEKSQEDKDTSDEEKIEIRGNSMWISIDKLDNLLLDGKEYNVSNETLETASSSHVTISYPLIIIDGKKIYHLETQNMVLDLTDILLQLEKVWGLEVAEDEYVWYSDVLLTSNDFSFIDNAIYLEQQDLIAVSMHSFYADVLDSIVMSFDVPKDEIRFVHDPFYGQVNHIAYSGDAEYLSYAYYTIGDSVTSYVDIVNESSMKMIERIEVFEALSKVDMNIDYDNIEIRVTKLYWEENNLIAILQVDDYYNTSIDKQEVEIVLWSKE